MSTTRPTADGSVVPAGRRRDVQGLRAVAVVVVIAFHLLGWPTGGYLGVDVFFVISGFVITGVLLRRSPSGRVDLRDFYLRRARRILPLAFLVLVATVLASYWTWSSEKANDIGLDAVASALFVGNWRFASTASDYFNMGAEPSPLQHYWSLGVEEQFYLVWPGLLLVAAIVAARRSPTPLRRLAPPLAVAIGAASGAYAAWLASTDPNVAYFSSLTRGWELALGCLLAVLPAPRGSERLRTTLSWLGVAGIAASVIVVDADAPFLGALAASTATGLAIVAGIGQEPRNLLLRNRVSDYLGELSYGLYLWHFPVIVIGAAWLTRGSPAHIGLSIVLTLVLAAAAHQWVERPFMEGRLRPAKMRGSAVAVGVVTMSLALAAGVAPGWWQESKPLAVTPSPTPSPTPRPILTASPTSSPSLIDSPSPTEPPPSSTPPPTPTPAPTIPPGQPVPLGETGLALQDGLRRGLALTTWPADLTPGTTAEAANPWPGSSACQSTKVADPTSCTYGNANGPELVVWGDSVGGNLLAAVESAFGSDYKVRGLTKSGCNINGANINYGAPPDICVTQRNQSIAYINRVKPKVVFVTETYTFATRLASKATGAARLAEWAAADRSLIEAIKPSGATVVFVAPSIPGLAFKDCHRPDGSPQACISSIPAWFGEIAQVERTLEGARFVETQHWYCLDDRCPMVSQAAGQNTMMKWDYIHASYAYDRIVAADFRYQVLAMGILP